MRHVADAPPFPNETAPFQPAPRRLFRRLQRSAVPLAASKKDAGEPRPLSIEAAERQLGMLLRRMRAYAKAPYDFAASRIHHDAEFDECLETAIGLSIRIAELAGTPVLTAEDRERIRDQLLDSLSARPDGERGVALRRR